MAENIPTVAYWMGQPISEMPRDELEKEFCAAHEKIERLQREASEESVAHIRDLAAMRQREMGSQKTPLIRLFDRIAG